MKRYSQKDNRRDYFPLVRTRRSIFDMLCPVLAPQFTSKLGKLETIKWHATEMVVAHKAWKERLMELGLFCPKKSKGGV